MITAVTPFSPEFMPFFPEPYAGKRAIYFDIETTGLSAQTSYVYLIGCACQEEDRLVLTQWLCTEPSEEKELLRLFFEKAKDFDLLLHYNGTSFDLPFLEKKAVRHRLTSPLTQLESLDLYRTARSMKSWFSLPDLKLKTMERFFGFSRTDVFSGEDLIAVYAKFLGLYRLNTMTNNKMQAEEHALTQVLLLHNAEDVKNLPSLTVLFFLLHLPAFFKAEQLLSLPPASGCKKPHFPPDSATQDSPVQFSCSYSLPFSIPKDFALSFPWETSGLRLLFSAEQGTVSFLLPVYEAELKYFYPDPADYYYLPLEDCAMHKSVASFVEKEYRKKATAATCYTKKNGAFLPLALRPASGKKAETKKEAENTPASLPCFFPDYKSKFAYTPLTNELLESPELLTILCRQLLGSLL